MALRDHSLDDKIICAAREDFLENGYAGASLRRIAKKAGATIGAIQTRYKSKDELFLRILKPLIDDIEKLFKDTRTDYYSDTQGDFLQSIKISMRHESSAILRLIFDHYEEAVLLMHRSAGSSLESFFDQIVRRKIDESALFFHNAGIDDIDEKLLGLLISAQFDSYRRIVRECSEKSAAEKYMNALMTYHFGGWTAFFEAVNKNREVK